VFVCTYFATYLILDVMKSTKLRQMRWVGHVVYMGNEKFAQNFNQKTSIVESTWEI